MSPNYLTLVRDFELNIRNPILRSDSYKYSHWKQLPEDLETVYSYLEARGVALEHGYLEEVVFFGLQYILKMYLSQPITMEHIDYAEERVTKHMGQHFNRQGFEDIVREFNGYFPVRIRAVPEGTVLSPHNVLLTIENLGGKKYRWVGQFIETLIMQIWYPITVASISRSIKVLIKQYLDETGDVAGLPFKLHDFGYRGVSSQESAYIGGAAHLVNFMGTDTFTALEMLKAFYGEDMAGFSIPAAEHGTIIVWGDESEYEAYKNKIDAFGNQEGGLYAIVIDSYDSDNAVDNVLGQMLHGDIMKAKASLVLRPDSGHPATVVLRTVELAGKRFGYTTNDKGYKVLNKVRVIQGDGINYNSIKEILETLKGAGWSADNIAFGMGGALLQQMNRDTLKFAIKPSSIVRGGRVKDVYKRPKTDNGKASKKGRLKLIQHENGQYQTFNVNEAFGPDVLRTVWECGELVIDDNLATIRQRAAV